MRFEEGVKEANGILKEALPQLAKYKIPITPYNYGLWYSLTAGNNPELAEELESYLVNQGTLTPAQSMELFKSHVVDDLLSMSVQLEDCYQVLFDNIRDSAYSTHASTSELMNDINTSLNDIEETKDWEEIQKTVHRLTLKGKVVENSTAEFKGALDEAQSEIQRLKEELRKAKEDADRDALTKLFNRRYFDRNLKTALELRKSNEKVAVIMVDVDHFKKFNDTYGHLVGDEVLKALSGTLESMCVDSKNVACRFGGEEFAILLPSTALASAKFLAENTCRRVSQIVLHDPKTRKPVSRITASLGVSFSNNSDTIETLVERADRALYRAKESGRNQVVAL